MDSAPDLPCALLNRPRSSPPRTLSLTHTAPSKRPPLPSNRVKLLCSADATPFELFRLVYTQDGYHQLDGSSSHPAGSSSGSSSSSSHAILSSGNGGGSSNNGAAHQHAGLHTAGGGSSAGGGEGGDLLVDNELGFSKDRTVSRLTEMQSLEYLAAHADAHDPSLKLALQEALDKKAAKARAAAAR